MLLAPLLILVSFLPQSAEADYNLDLLHRMLDCHAVQGLVSKGSYNQVIDKWVQDVRSSSPSSGTSRGQEEDDAQDVSGYHIIANEQVIYSMRLCFHFRRKSSLHNMTPTVSLFLYMYMCIAYMRSLHVVYIVSS